MANSIVIFFDGQCPLCQKEMNKLVRYDKSEQIHLVDIFSTEFDDYPAIDQQEAADIIHVLLPNGELLTGLNALHYAWQSVGKGWLYAPTRWKVWRSLWDRLYLLFAQNRYRVSKWLTGKERCHNGACKR
ncbi:DUF393 domain-containing protein [Photobacterium damselae subsp. damselae]|uniref:thiol-disulfide oxidoreductase DCC family protein n=1 Tax=Photobacterium damselae TaxID=38293 RepID=UPI000D04C498|nr:DUF393 domain-containing protein [Photobacterium damselae]PSB76469.1 DUF393 domain-containing protein [Photobacterium damselae subsp. damselae]